MTSRLDSTCNLCGSLFTARNGHTCPTLTTTRMTTTQSQTRQDETMFVNGVPISRKTSMNQQFSSESFSFYNQNHQSLLQPTGTSPQYTPHTAQPASRRIPAADTSLISEPSDQRSIRLGGDRDGETRIWLRGGGGDGGSSNGGARKGKDLYLTWKVGKNRKKQYYLHRNGDA